MFADLEQINHRPKPFECYTAADLWTDEHTAQRMLDYHLNPDLDVSSRNAVFIDRSAEWMTKRFALDQNKRVADFGCGPGLYANRLARRGVGVTGIDFSSSSIAYARKTASADKLSVNYVCQNYLEFETDEHVDLIIMIMCDYCALSPEQRGRLLALFKRLLAPGGSVLLDVYSLKAYEQREEGASYAENLLDGFWSPHKYYGFLNTFKYDEEKVVLDKYTLVEAHRTRTVYNWLQYFSPEDLEQEFGRAGLPVKARLADVAGTDYCEDNHEFAIIAGDQS